MAQLAFGTRGSADPHKDRFAYQQYVIKRPFLSLLGRKFYVYAPDGSLVVFLKHPLLKLRGEFTIYTDETETTPLLVVRARKVIAINMAHDVFDPNTGELLGSIRSRGLKSIIRDVWDILDANDQPVGLIEETGFAMLRRLIKFLPGQHKIELNGQLAATLRQKFRFFIKEEVLDLSPGGDRLDHRFAIACALLVLMKEAAREDQSD
ncbi:MAG TPA: hypothetical protein VGG01_07555 [Xanthobacteraceae bacterium]